MRVSVPAPILVRAPEPPTIPPIVTALACVSNVSVTPELIVRLLASVPATPAWSVALPVKLTVPLPSAARLPKFNVPAESVVPPVYVLELLKVTRPDPVSASVPVPDPEINPLTVKPGFVE